MVVFRAGDYRSTLDDKEMARASSAREEALELNHMLLERLRELNKGQPSFRKPGRTDERYVALFPGGWCGR